jgi:ADP-heptose:LPS heptosyltransferase
MRRFRESVVSLLPGPVHSALRPWWRRYFRFKLRLRDWWMPFIVLIVWLVFQCARRGKRAVIICRFGGIGDVLCTLPICEEARRRHPGKLLVFVTAAIWRDVVRMSRSADLVYANRAWIHPLTMPTRIKLFGLVDRIYNPQTTRERLSHTFGTSAHLIDDLAASCGFAVATRLPTLSPSSGLIAKVRARYGLDDKGTGHQLVIGINPGPSWPVLEWEGSKWQKLINRIHSQYDAVIIQFGIIRVDGFSDYNNLRGVKSVAGRLTGEEIVVLISICDLVISIDSGPVHVAGAVGTPVIGLFGPLDPASRLPPNSPAPALGLVSDVPCLFCHNRTPVIHWITGCPNDIACMKKLNEQIVFETVKSMLAPDKRREIKEPLTLFD